LISHKHVDVAIEACNRLSLDLIIVGEGPERTRLEKLAGKTIHFAGKVDETELRRLYCEARALIFPSHEDFGLVPIEAQACGRPVIAFGQGGVLETVKEGVTGKFFAEQTSDSLQTCLQDFHDSDFDPSQIRDWSGQFDVLFLIKRSTSLSRITDTPSRTRGSVC
jgi:glycosyltransferase involved in cell wall biosynthesis